MAPSHKTKAIPNGGELSALAGRLAADQSTMTLATSANKDAWAAPVYYVFFRSAFYFLSSPDSRHIAEALENDQAAAAIYASGSTWQEIRGLQMTGSINAVSGKIEAIQGLSEYLKKFPFTKDFFKDNKLLDPKGFWERFGVKLYRFQPSLVYYLDNRIRFAFREQVKF
jgi:uncharacterized protein YhbP (UPF0306 family)